MKKRIFTVLLAAAMTVSLAACAGTAENNAGKKTEETSAGQSVSKEAAESEAASKETPGENTPEQAASDEKASGGNAPEQSVGIGLALSRSIAAAQNGTLTAANVPGGAEFTMKLYKGIV